MVSLGHPGAGSVPSRWPGSQAPSSQVADFPINPGFPFLLLVPLKFLLLFLKCKRLPQTFVLRRGPLRGQKPPGSQSSNCRVEPPHPLASLRGGSRPAPRFQDNQKKMLKMLIPPIVGNPSPAHLSPKTPPEVNVTPTF